MHARTRAAGSSVRWRLGPRRCRGHGAASVPGTCGLQSEKSVLRGLDGLANTSWTPSGRAGPGARRGGPVAAASAMGSSADDDADAEAARLAVKKYASFLSTVLEVRPPSHRRGLVLRCKGRRRRRRRDTLRPASPQLTPSLPRARRPALLAPPRSPRSARSSRSSRSSPRRSTATGTSAPRSPRPRRRPPRPPPLTPRPPLRRASRR